MAQRSRPRTPVTFPERENFAVSPSSRKQTSSCASPSLLVAALSVTTAGLLAVLLLQRTGPPQTGEVSQHQRACQRYTRSGICTEDFFDAVDEAYRDLWPGTVDLLLRSHMSDKFFLLETHLRSIELMWPKGIGDVVLVLDKGEEEAVGLLPSWLKVFFEENRMNLPGKILQQWSYGWADKYTTADFVAIIDDDVIFGMKVTPPLLFNMTEGRPYVIGSDRHQRKVWAQATNFLVGKGRYVANFMVQLPFVVPRGVFSEFRDHVGRLHVAHGGSYDAAFKWFSRHAKPFGRDQIQHAALGNYLFHFHPEKVHIALEWTPHIPIPRVGIHIPWTMKFYAGTNYTDYSPKVTELYVEVASHYALEGLCFSFPKGELPECDNFDEPQQAVVWKYALDWGDWLQIFKKKEKKATRVYDQHRQELACIYDGLREMGKAWSSKGVHLRQCVIQ